MPPWIAVLVLTAATLFVTSATPKAAVGDANEGATTSVAAQSAISAGFRHTCAVISDGTARCWGTNGAGQLGIGTYTPSASSTPEVVVGLAGAAAMAAGTNNTCALMNDGTARCWGNNTYGQLGSADSTTVPVTVTGLVGASAITTHTYHSCVLINDGTARCFGDNVSGQLGNGGTTDSGTPVTVTGLNGATAIVAGNQHTCALIDDGTARCWGRNNYGQLGDGTSIWRTTPVAVTGLTGATAITAGFLHTCALINDGTVRCWGSNTWGELGSGSTPTLTRTPTVVTGLTGATAISTSDSHTCALIDDGTARCWGWNRRGQLGNGTTNPGFDPTLHTVSGLTGAIAITTGFEHSCALIDDGTVRCWGYNFYGELGDGTTTLSTTPVTVIGLDVFPPDPNCVSVDPTGIIGWWRGEGDLTAQVGPDASGTVTYGPGRAGQAFSITQGSQLAAIGAAQPTIALTLELWVAPQPDPWIVQTLISRWSGVGFTNANDEGHAYNLELYPNNELVFEVDDASTRVPEQLRVAAPQLVDGNLHHVAATWTTTAMTLYIDGAQVAGKPSQGGQIQTGGATPVRIGGPFAFTGIIDEPTIWSRSLSPAEIASVAAANGGKCP